MAYDNTTVIRVSHNTLGGEVLRELSKASVQPRQVFLGLAKWFERLAAGIGDASVELVLNGTTGVRASATATIVSAAANDAVTINGVAFTAIANGGSPTGNQWAVGAGGTADADSATALAAAINASTTAKVQNYVTATAASNVVTIRAKQPGLAGNMFTLTDTGTTITVTGSGFLTGGAGDNVSAVTFSRS